MPTVLIPASILALAPDPKTKSAVAATKSALASGMPTPTSPLGSKPYTTINISDELYSVIASGRGAASRYICAAIIAQYGGGGVTQDPPPSTNTYAPPAVDPSAPTTAEQRRIAAARTSRVQTAREDIEDGKWGRIILTAGHRSVDMWREDGDYYDEIESGLVFRATIPTHLSAEDGRAWLIRKATDSSLVSRMHWWYIDGDSETLTVARDAQMRQQAIIEGGTTAEAVRMIEAEETLQVRLLGRRTVFLLMAQHDQMLLGRDTHPNVKKLALLAPVKKNLHTGKEIG